MRTTSNRTQSRQFTRSSFTSQCLRVGDTVIISVPEDDLMAVVGSLPLVSLHKRVGEILQIHQDEALVQLFPSSKTRRSSSSSSAAAARRANKENEVPFSGSSMPAVSHLTAFMSQRQEKLRTRQREESYEQVTVPTFVLCLQDYVLQKRMLLAQSEMHDKKWAEPYRWTPELASTAKREENNLLGWSMVSGRTS